MSINNYYMQLKSPQSGERSIRKGQFERVSELQTATKISSIMPCEGSLGVQQSSLTPTPSTSESLSEIPQKRLKLNETQSVMVATNLFQPGLPSTSEAFNGHESFTKLSSLESVIEILPKPKLTKQEQLALYHADDYDWASERDPDEVGASTQEIEFIGEFERKNTVKRLENRKSESKNIPTCSNILENSQNRPLLTLKPPPADEEQYSLEKVVKSFNMAKGKVTNEVNWREIYVTKKCKFQGGETEVIGSGTHYNLDDIVPPEVEPFKRLFEIICSVFSAPVNFGYFNEEERRFVFKILTSRSKEQSFLMVFLLRTGGEWCFIKDRNYGRLVDVKIKEESFAEMLRMGFLESAYQSLDGSFFDIFDDAFLLDLYRTLRLGSPRSRTRMISTLAAVFRQENNADVNDLRHKPLTSYLRAQKGPILRLSSTLISLTHRVLTLYYPDHNPHHGFSKIIIETLDPHNPICPITRFPFFNNRQSLIDYVEAKLILIKIDKIIEEKATGYCGNLKKYGDAIHKKLKDFVAAVDREDSNRRSACNHVRESPKLPPHIEKFSPAFLWSKILTLIIKAFRKQRNLIPANKYLNFLLNNRKKILVNRVTLYKEAIEIKINLLKKYRRLFSSSRGLTAFSRKFIRKAFVPPVTKQTLRRIVNQKNVEFSFRKIPKRR